ncbi:MAG TPA: transglycosylase SLT domain-containing protein [Arenimonas sp.]|nr:transglycosylase SLT domain-containing protein [Arenimonas sp.]
MAAPDADTGAAVFERLRLRLTQPACLEGAQNRSWRRRYAANPSRFAAQLEAILPMLDYVLGEVEAAELPGEFALIPLVESGYRPDAVAPGGPTGLWQFVPGTARHFGIAIAPGYDGRLAPLDATPAAISYLDSLHQRFGDWRATAMAYNAGEYRLKRALKRSGDDAVSGEERLPAGLAKHTYDYVAKLRALACLVSEPEANGIELPEQARFVPLARVELPPAVTTLDQAAELMDLDAAQLRELNPAYRPGRITAAASRQVLAPLAPGMHAAFVDAAAALPPPPPPPREHVVAAGDTLSTLARRYGVTLANLLAWNRLRGDSILRIGQRLQLGP